MHSLVILQEDLDLARDSFGAVRNDRAGDAAADRPGGARRPRHEGAAPGSYGAWRRLATVDEVFESKRLQESGHRRDARREDAAVVVARHGPVLRRTGLDDAERSHPGHHSGRVRSIERDDAAIMGSDEEDVP